ncbi:MAG: NAD(P)-dependent oxidoreductase [Burkholderiales bacterium]|nr:NAD(P)-dependent oxidoreductase [Burkholderiales bacterium]
MSRIGFIGLGRMGRPMAINLVRKGFDLTVLDIQPAATAAVVAAGATAGASVAAVAQASDIVVTMLPSSVEVEAVCLGADGVFANAPRGALLMDMSTIDPLATDRLAAAAVAHGMTMVDAPVGRLAEHADRGESLFMVGASDADFARVKPLMEAMGNAIYHCGPVGSGGRTKLVNNFVAITLTQVNAEALALSQRFGLDLVRTMQVLLGTSAANGQLRMNLPSKVLAGDTTPGFTIDLAHKDLSLVVGAAHAARVPMPVAAAVHEAFSLARAAGHGAIDFSGMTDVLCEFAKIDKPRLPKGWTPG